MFEQVITHPTLYASLLFGLGLLIGSFLNVVILRLPPSMKHQWTKQCLELIEGHTPPDSPSVHASENEPPPTLVAPCSRCPKCKINLVWWQNIPLLSFLVLRGKCHACKQAISFRYPLVELLTGGLTVAAGFVFPDVWVLPWILVALWMLICLSFIDYDTYLLPDNITLPLLWLGLLFNTGQHGFVSAMDAIIGAVAGYMALWTIYQIHHFITKREGMGYGDFKLLAAAGAWLGWKMLPLTLLIAACSGLIIALSLIILKKRDKSEAISFGPYIAIAFLIMIFWGPTILQNYYQFIGING